MHHFRICFSFFPDFCGIDFGIDLFIEFVRKMAPKMVQGNLCGFTLLAPFSRPFPKIDFLMHFDPPLAHFWHTLVPSCSLVVPLALFRLTFGTFCLPFAPFWLPFASFCLPLAYFCHLLAPRTLKDTSGTPLGRSRQPLGRL